jgi:putative ATP-binding cassette transporter
MLIIRWRRWLTEHYIGAGSARTPLRRRRAALTTDQRIAEDVNRIISGGEEGYGVSYSILAVAT